jgi:hypothetical protein
MKLCRCVGGLFTAIVLSASSALAAQEPGWKGTVIARGELRQEIQSTPIVERPYRPLHFYGNTVRREYYRGVAMPLPRDFVNGTRAFIGRR